MGDYDNALKRPAAAGLRILLVIGALVVAFYAIFSSLGTSDVGYGWVSLGALAAALAALGLAFPRPLWSVVALIVASVGTGAALIIT
jgi:hypothetical protein